MSNTAAGILLIVLGVLLGAVVLLASLVLKARWTQTLKLVRGRPVSPPPSDPPPEPRFTEPLPVDQIALKLARKAEYARLPLEQRDLIAKQIHDKASHLIAGARPRHRRAQ